MADFPATGPSKWTATPFLVLYVIGYVALVVWFKQVDVYHEHFSQSGSLVLVNNIFRVLFIFYLFWMVHAAGMLTLRLVAREAIFSVGLLDSLALGFFAGTGIFHLALLLLGFLNLYFVSVAVAITLPLVILSAFNVCAFFTQIRQMISVHFTAVRYSRLWPVKIIVGGALLGLLAVVVCLLLIVKGLYPAGGHDYFTHYFYYYQSVISHHGLKPNEVWYHFYYSKGAGLYFLGILLTDPLAPQLVTYCFIIAAALALFQLLRRLAPRSLWPWVGVVIYLGLYIYTPGPMENRVQGGWGDFEKLHELNAALIISLLWIVAGAAERRGRVALAWWGAAASATCAAVIINITVAAYVGAVFAILSLWYLARRQWRVAAVFIALGIVAGVLLAGTLIINFTATGLINDQGILWFWPFANIEKLQTWGALPSIITLHWATDRMVMDNRFLAGMPFSRQSLEFLFHALRLDLLWPLVAAGVVMTIDVIARRRHGPVAHHHAAVLTAAIVSFVLLAWTAGRDQPISFYRYSSFVIPIVIAAGVLLCNYQLTLAGQLFVRAFRGRLVPLAVLVGCGLMASVSYPAGAFSTIVGNATRFAIGQISIDTAYGTQTDWPGRVPWGAIYPGSRAAYDIVGPHVPIWSMHIHSYCMLPDCRMMSYGSFIMTSDLDRVMFGSPETARTALQKAGINYFLFSRELSEHVKMVDILPLSPLFSPDTIGRYLGIRWTDGKTALLTWTGPDTQPFDAAWIADYRKALANSPTAASFPYDAMREIYARLRTAPHPWQPFELPCKREHPTAMC